MPDPGSKDGPLPPLLVAMTFVTGLVDAFSYLVLGHVFVANMTGNVVFLGFALARAPGFSIGASAVALASFWLGALAGGKVGSMHGTHRGRLLNTSAAIQAALLAVSVVLAALSGSPTSPGYRYALIVVLGMAMGIQNAAARKLAVADLTTTVLTMTITGSAADSTIAGGKGSKARAPPRRRSGDADRSACRRGVGSACPYRLRPGDRRHRAGGHCRDRSRAWKLGPTRGPS